MTQGILLVDEKLDILRLLHSTLDSLGNIELEILEASSGEEALLEASRHKIDLLVTDYLLPGIRGIELMHKIRARHPDVKTILLNGTSDRKVRDEVLNAGVMAMFDKPIPLADFLDAVERTLGLSRTILPSETTADARSAARYSRLSDLLANFRQDVDAQAVFLLNDRGLVLARAGDLRDSSMEVSLLSALMAIHNAGLKVSRYIHQEDPDAYHIFRAGDHDLLFITVNAMYALLVAGNDLVSEQRVVDSLQSVLALRAEVDKSLKTLGVTGELIVPEKTGSTSAAPKSTSAAAPKKKRKTQDLPVEGSAPEMESLLKDAKRKVKVDDLDSYWDQAAEKHNKAPTDADVISYDEARKLGLAPDKDH